MKAYINPLLATSDLILVSDVLTVNSANFTQPWYFWDNNTSTMDRGGLNSSLLYGFISGSDHVDWGESTKWVCSDWYILLGLVSFMGCRSESYTIDASLRVSPTFGPMELVERAAP